MSVSKSSLRHKIIQYESLAAYNLMSGFFVSFTGVQREGGVAKCCTLPPSDKLARKLISNGSAYSLLLSGS